MQRLVGVCVPIAFLGIYLMIEGMGELTKASPTDNPTRTATVRDLQASHQSGGWNSVAIGLLLQVPLASVFVGAWLMDQREQRRAEEALANGRLGPLGPVEYR